MQSLAVALKANTHEGDPLPDVYPVLAKLGAHFRRGQVSMIAGAPGGGKSLLACDILLGMEYPDGTSPSVLYFSADSDKGTIGTRLGAAISNQFFQDVEEELKNPEAEIWDQISESLSNVWFNWNSSPSYKDIEGELQSYCEVTGQYPDLIIVDNLKNMVSENGGASHEQYDEIMEYLKILAIETKSHVMVLHHVTGVWENGDMPIPLSGLLGKPGKPCRLILTLYSESRDPDVMGICVVKNSNGKAAADASIRIGMPIIPAKAWFGRAAGRLL